MDGVPPRRDLAALYTILHRQPAAQGDRATRRARPDLKCGGDWSARAVENAAKLAGQELDFQKLFITQEEDENGLQRGRLEARKPEGCERQRVPTISMNLSMSPTGTSCVMGFPSLSRTGCPARSSRSRRCPRSGWFPGIGRPINLGTGSGLSGTGPLESENSCSLRLAICQLRGHIRPGSPADKSEHDPIGLR